MDLERRGFVAYFKVFSMSFNYSYFRTTLIKMISAKIIKCKQVQGQQKFACVLFFENDKKKLQYNL
jgi:hypothetical protein